MHWIALRLQPEPLSCAGAKVSLAPDAARLADPVTALGWWALQFTPKVAWVDGALVLEVSASERLFGGRRGLIQRLFKEKMPLAPVNRSQGATSLIAIARLHSRGQRARHPDELPLAALAAARAHLATLQTMGCTRWGQLRALPRAGVARRFGAALVDALDQAYGLRPDVYPWLQLPEVFEARLDLAARVESAPALMFGARRLLGQLQVWLQLRQQGVLGLALGWELEGARRAVMQTESAHAAGDAPGAALASGLPDQLVIRSAQATRDMGHLQRLLAEHLARVTLSAPAQMLWLRALETAPLGGASASLLPDDVPLGDSLQQLTERLSARLSPQAVMRVQPWSDHRPERMQVWQACMTGAKNATYSIANKVHSTGAICIFEHKSGVFYPTWLLAEPLRLAVQQQVPQYQGALTLLAGPQRLETGWWTQGGRLERANAAALRDYYVARSQQAQLLWIYRERLNARQSQSHWYLHGLFA